MNSRTEEFSFWKKLSANAPIVANVIDTMAYQTWLSSLTSPMTICTNRYRMWMSFELGGIIGYLSVRCLDWSRSNPQSSDNITLWKQRREGFPSRLFYFGNHFIVKHHLAKRKLVIPFEYYIISHPIVFIGHRKLKTAGILCHFWATSAQKSS